MKNVGQKLLKFVKENRLPLLGKSVLGDLDEGLDLSLNCDWDDDYDSFFEANKILHFLEGYVVDRSQSTKHHQIPKIRQIPNLISRAALNVFFAQILRLIWIWHRDLREALRRSIAQNSEQVECIRLPPECFVFPRVNSDSMETHSQYSIFVFHFPSTK